MLRKGSNIKTIRNLIHLLLCTGSINTHETATFLLLFLSEFLAEESQEKFWDFVEANENIDGEHDGNVTCRSHS